MKIKSQLEQKIHTKKKHKWNEMKYILTHIFSSMLVNTQLLGSFVKNKIGLNEWIAKFCVTAEYRERLESDRKSTKENRLYFCDYLSSCFVENTNMNVKCVRSTKIDAAFVSFASASAVYLCLSLMKESMQLY